jgi:S1-C subfamily serine protease
MPLLAAGLVQSLLFGFSHFFGVTHAIVAFVLGLLLTAIYHWRKTLIAPILVHAGLNFISAVGTVLMMIAYANSPIVGVIGDPSDKECVIREVAPHSAAEEAGLQVDDVITSFNGQPIGDFSHFVQTVRLYRPGDAIGIKIKRSDAVLEVIVVLRRRGDL